MCYGTAQRYALFSLQVHSHTYRLCSDFGSPGIWFMFVIYLWNVMCCNLYCVILWYFILLCILCMLLCICFVRFIHAIILCLSIAGGYFCIFLGSWGWDEPSRVFHNYFGLGFDAIFFYVWYLQRAKCKKKERLILVVKLLCLQFFPIDLVVLSYGQVRLATRTLTSFNFRTDKRTQALTFI